MNMIGIDNVEGYSPDILMKMNMQDKQKMIKVKKLKSIEEKKKMGEINLKELMNNDILG